jgi:hypothetical protein
MEATSNIQPSVTSQTTDIHNNSNTVEGKITSAEFQKELIKLNKTLEGFNQVYKKIDDFFITSYMTHQKK